MLTIEADAVATRATIELVAGTGPADLGRPTPCSEWDLNALLAHMTAQHRGFAAAARGAGGDPAAWRAVTSPDPVGAYRAAAEDVLAAFAQEGVVEQEFALPEITDRPVPGRLAIGFHLVDHVVHGWDVARALGVGYRPAEDVLAAALPIARAVPDDATRREAGAAFAPARPVPAGAGALDEILARLGRQP